MELASLFIAMLKPLLWLLPLFALGAVLASPWFKGLLGEYTVRRLIARRLDPSIYREFSYVTIRARDGTTQIDHIYVSPFGILVIETKNMKGWIFGNRNQARWTQTIFRNKSQFQNPLRQNHRHIKVLEELLELPFSAFKSIIVFTGDCTFKTEMPDEVCTCSDLIEYIYSIDKPILSDDQIADACDRIRTMRMERSWRTHRAHMDSLRRRHRTAVAPRLDVGFPRHAVERSAPSHASPLLAPRRRWSGAAGVNRDRDWGPPIFAAAVLLVLMVSCIRITSRNDATAKMPVRQVAPVVTTPRPVPVATHQHQRVSEVTTHTQAPRLKRQTPEEAREAKRRADAAMEVIKATTPEM